MKINHIQTVILHNSYQMTFICLKNWLKEIAGTRVYDDKRAESMKLFKKSEEDRTKIQQGLSHIVDKLESLEQDKEDFTQVCEYLKK